MDNLGVHFPGRNSQPGDPGAATNAGASPNRQSGHARNAQSDIACESPRRVLFVCTLNAVRSPMAYALAQSVLPEGVQTESAGIYHADPVDETAVAVMREIGLDIALHHPHTVSDLEAEGDDLGDYDLVVALSKAAMESTAAAAANAGVALEFWPISDPSSDPRADSGDEEGRLTAYRAVREELRARLRARFNIR